ncbi:MAG: leucine-rich repeat domain-containing protein [Holosporales bacterium]|jgi:hypothetical protein|nr:leucine-rich repeat domain-containing protein [Holosporales bacterium]
MVGKFLTLAMMSASNVFCSQVEYQLNDEKVTETVRDGDVPFIAGHNVVFINGQTYDINSIVLSGSRVKWYVKDVVIPQNIVKIPVSAFADCLNLQVVTFESGSHLAEIGNCAFYRCQSLMSTIIPKGVTSLGDEAFYGCNKLACVVFEPGSELSRIGASAFSGCTPLSSIAIPNGVTHIGRDAFCGCSLRAIVIPSSVTSLSGFNQCKELAKVTFEAGNNLTEIGEQAFNGCYTLDTITIPKSVVMLGAAAFNSCHGLANVTFEAGSRLDRIKSCAFGWCSSLSSITIPDSVTCIEASAFCECPLREIVIPSSVTSLSGFGQCRELASVTFEKGNNLTEIGMYAFIGCTSLATIAIPKSVVTLGKHAFSNCTNLTSVTFEQGSRLNEIQSCAFSSCDQLTTITLPDGITSIGWDAFSGSALQSINIPDRVTSLSHTFNGCESLSIVTFTPNSQLRKIGDATFRCCSRLQSINIPKHVKHIRKNAFNRYVWYKKLPVTEAIGESITITFDPDSELQTIGDRAFYACNLDDITIPKNVVSIAAQAFGNCTNLSSVTFDQGSPERRLTIEDEAFIRCNSLQEIHIPGCVVDIKPSTFRNCTSLRTVTIESRDTNIASGAFRDCPLRTITFGFEIGGSDFASFLMATFGAQPGCTVYFNDKTCKCDATNGWIEQPQ